MNTPATLETIVQLAVTTLTDNKAKDIEQIDVSSLTEMMDYVVVASATSTRHAKALANKLVRAAREIDLRPLSINGEQQGEWVLIDLQDVVVHIMLPEVREYYSLEKLWSMTEETRRQDAD